MCIGMQTLYPFYRQCLIYEAHILSISLEISYQDNIKFQVTFFFALSLLIIRGGHTDLKKKSTFFWLPIEKAPEYVLNL